MSIVALPEIDVKNICPEIFEAIFNKYAQEAVCFLNSPPRPIPSGYQVITEELCCYIGRPDKTTGNFKCLQVIAFRFRGDPSDGRNLTYTRSFSRTDLIKAFHIFRQIMYRRTMMGCQYERLFLSQKIATPDAGYHDLADDSYIINLDLEYQALKFWIETLCSSEKSGVPPTLLIENSHSFKRAGGPGAWNIGSVLESILDLSIFDPKTRSEKELDTIYIVNAFIGARYREILPVKKWINKMRGSHDKWVSHQRDLAQREKVACPHSQANWWQQSVEGDKNPWMIFDVAIEIERRRWITDVRRRREVDPPEYDEDSYAKFPPPSDNEGLGLEDCDISDVVNAGVRNDRST